MAAAPMASSSFSSSCSCWLQSLSLLHSNSLLFGRVFCSNTIFFHIPLILIINSSALLFLCLFPTLPFPTSIADHRDFLIPSSLPFMLSLPSSCPMLCACVFY
ncbi:hypothetical protein O6H91_17G090700 [Diphasiastrum complanatum]|uniref:Uncharacterized protein n=1 Tax=Diphasiastrum complanatum TaxID=34168 RepID=A0ACC2B8Z0_DIPCM|nr:hypothetical protein O6H91_17G090700 [Diphasiastrum complanatum]